MVLFSRGGGGGEGFIHSFKSQKFSKSVELKLHPKTSKFFSFEVSSSTMFRFHCKRLVIQTRNKINGRDSSSTTTTLFHFLQNPSSSSSLIMFRFMSCSTISKDSFVISYLMNSLGLSKEEAISASKKVRSIKTPDKPDSVLTLLRDNGFTQPYISKLITKRPKLLLADTHKTLRPKFDFFNSIGLKELELAKVLSTDSTVLTKSLEKHIIPSYHFLKSVVRTNFNVISVLKRSTWVLLNDPTKQMIPNVSILRDNGVPEPNILKLLTNQPRSILKNTDRFKEIVEQIKGMEIDPSQFAFTLAIHALTSMTKSSLDSKFNVYRSWGWSEEEVRTAFRKQPYCMVVSEKKIMRSMDFFVNQMGCNPSLIARNPTVLNFSLEKRIIPRSSVFQLLVSKDLLSKDSMLTSALTMVENSFLKRYVTKYEEEVPELLNVYLEKLKV